MPTTSKTVLVGTVLEDLEIDTKIDLTPYPTVSLLVRGPDNVETTWAVSFLDSDPTNGILVHTFQVGDLYEAGDYLIHAKLENGSGANRISNMTTLKCVALFSHPNY